MDDFKWVSDIRPAIDWSDVKDLDGRRFVVRNDSRNIVYEFNSNWPDVPRDVTHVQRSGSVNPSQSCEWVLSLIRTYFDDGSWIWVD